MRRGLLFGKGVRIRLGLTTLPRVLLWLRRLVLLLTRRSLLWMVGLWWWCLVIGRRMVVRLLLRLRIPLIGRVLFRVGVTHVVLTFTGLIRLFEWRRTAFGGVVGS